MITFSYRLIWSIRSTVITTMIKCAFFSLSFASQFAVYSLSILFQRNGPLLSYFLSFLICSSSFGISLSQMIADHKVQLASVRDLLRRNDRQNWMKSEHCTHTAPSDKSKREKHAHGNGQEGNDYELKRRRKTKRQINPTWNVRIIIISNEILSEHKIDEKIELQHKCRGPWNEQLARKQYQCGHDGVERKWIHTHTREKPKKMVTSLARQICLCWKMKRREIRNYSNAAIAENGPVMMGLEVLFLQWILGMASSLLISMVH